MAKTTSYYIYGNKLFYPSTTKASIKNHLSDEDVKAANIYKPHSYGANPFGTDFTNRYMTDYSGSPYDNLVFYYQLINQKY